MIFDAVVRLDHYETIPLREDIIKFMTNHDLTALEEGDHALSGDDLVLKILDYETRPSDELFFETHEQHIDLQIVLKGEERMELSCKERLISADGPPGISGDFQFYKPQGGFSTLYVSIGFFAVFFPWDAHRPGCSADDISSLVKKAVFKIKI